MKLKELRCLAETKKEGWTECFEQNMVKDKERIEISDVLLSSEELKTMQRQLRKSFCDQKDEKDTIRDQPTGSQF